MCASFLGEFVSVYQKSTNSGNNALRSSSASLPASSAWEVKAADIGGALGGLVIRGIADRSTLVHAEAGGDVDDDLLQEVLIGAPNARDELGQVYLLTGKLIRDTIAQAQAAGKEAELDLRALFPELSDF